MAADHIVPVQMIRRFADARGQLWELRKPELKISTKPRRARGILFADTYYRDVAANFDDQLKPIEQAFAKHYDAFADERITAQAKDISAGNALVQWIASMLARTEMIRSCWEKVGMIENPALAVLSARYLHSFLRTEWYWMMLGMLTRPKFKWAFKTVDDGIEFVLTDTPVILAKSPAGASFMVIAPLTRTRLILGGLQEDLDAMRTASARALNAHLAAWCRNRIYSGSKPTLALLEVELQARSEDKAVREPYCDHLSTIDKSPAPTNEQASTFWNEMVGRFGPKTLPD